MHFNAASAWYGSSSYAFSKLRSWPRANAIRLAAIWVQVSLKHFERDKREVLD